MEHVLITGGAGGIGSAIADAFHKNGAFVYAVDIDVAAGKAMQKKYGERFRFLELDVTDATAIEKLVRSLPENFKLNHIITLAGRALPDEWGGFAGMSVAAIDSSVRLNLSGHLNVINAFLPYLQREQGDKSVVMISSINAQGGYGLPVYSAAKAGLVGFAAAAAAELGGLGIRINAVSPGTVVTPNTLGEPKDFDSLLHSTALGRFTTAADVAELVLAVCTRFTSVTGHDFVIDAGQTKIHQ